MARNPGLAGTRSQRPARLSGAIAVLESAANDIGSTARLPGRVAAAPIIGIGVRAARPRATRARCAESDRTAAVHARTDLT